MIIHVLLYFSDSLPLPHILFSVFCHVVYLQNFTPRWPFISLTSLNFIASCILVISDHFVWFFHFAHVTQDARHRARHLYRGSTPRSVPGFADIATFFGICVWLAPLFLFLSLSANDNALPTSAGISSVSTTPTNSVMPSATRPRVSLFKSLYDTLSQVRPRPRRRDTSEGIIAPRSPNVVRPPTPSPLQTPTRLPRVSSMNSLPPPLILPRRVSSDGHPPESAARLLSPEPTEFSLLNMSTQSMLGTASRRLSGAKTSSRRPSTEGRLEMRRAASAHVSSNAASAQE
ncbi:hypothetical protein AcW1_004473 [Taiwanofungus camphoratus]|nr:hypothetical protein AcW2_006522 [Antrodia cinnamomea]KAI0952346.1 hypothetical protein AcV7_008188 [Antrodia cinnamomea]KAI0959729.1 hypothetical protein AcW1_004473 [Antrodia cinnamomea]